MSYFDFRRKFIIRVSSGKGKDDYEGQRRYVFEKGVNKEPVPEEVVKSPYFERLVEVGEIIPVGDFTPTQSHNVAAKEAPSLGLERGNADDVQMVGPDAAADKVKKVKKGKS